MAFIYLICVFFNLIYILISMPFNNSLFHPKYCFYFINTISYFDLLLLGYNSDICILY